MENVSCLQTGGDGDTQRLSGGRGGFFVELGINCFLGISSAEENPDDFVAVLTPTEKPRCGTFEDRMHIIS